MGVTGGQWIRFSGYAWATVQTCAKGDISLSECVRVVPRQALSDISDPYCPVRRAVGRVVAPRPKPMLVSGIQIATRPGRATRGTGRYAEDSFIQWLVAWHSQCLCMVNVLAELFNLYRYVGDWCRWNGGVNVCVSVSSGYPGIVLAAQE